MKYGTDDRPGIYILLLYALQWWIVSLPAAVILGLIAARLHHAGIQAQIFYLQKLFGVMGIVTVLQAVWGHRLPLIVGPAAVLLVGVVASGASGMNAVHTAISIGGLALAFVSYSGLLTRLRVFFTPRIVAVILILIAFALMPSILRMATEQSDKTAGLCFTLLTTFALILCNARLPGVLKTLTVLFGLAGGSLCHFFLFGFPAPQSIPPEAEAPFFFIGALDVQFGALLSFLFCFLALTANEIGSVESIGHMLRAKNMDTRLRRGAGLQGLANTAAGAFGIIGMVDYSLSTGVIAATGCASRFALIPAGAGLAACAFFPGAILALCHIPSAVMGALMLYLMTSQLAGGLHMLVADKSVTDFTGGICVGLPIMLGLLISFTPPEIFDAFPVMFRPVVGNGFVVGTLTVILLDHVVFGKR